VAAVQVAGRAEARLLQAKLAKALSDGAAAQQQLHQVGAFHPLFLLHE